MLPLTSRGVARIMVHRTLLHSLKRYGVSSSKGVGTLAKPLVEMSVSLECP